MEHELSDIRRRNIRRRILVHSGIALALGFLGLYLAYGPFMSKSWYWAFGAYETDGTYYNLGGPMEFLRLVMILLFFVVGQDWLFRDVAAANWRGGVCLGLFFPPRGLGRYSSVALAVLVLVYHGLLGPLKLHADYSAHFDSGPLRFRESFLPYLGYMGYSLAVWLLLALPMFTVIVRSITREIHKSRRYVRRMEFVISNDEGMVGVEATKALVDDVQWHIGSSIGKYLLFSILVAAYLFVELFAGVCSTFACWTQELTKWGGWAFIVALLPAVVIGKAKLYSRVFTGCQNRLHTLRRLAIEDDNSELAGRLGKDIKELGQATMWSFMKSLRTHSLAVAFFVAVSIVGYRIARKAEITPRDFLETTMPWPVSPVVLYCDELLSGSAEAMDWKPRCLELHSDKPPPLRRGEIYMALPSFLTGESP
jgi:hypothetical protein